MKHQLVIGLGEVGQALRNILQCDGYDLGRGIPAAKEKYDVIHIAFPYTAKLGEQSFIEYVKKYQHQFSPSLTVIHSSVPIGTSEQLDAVASPIRGVHPNLEEGIRTFVKFFGGRQADEACRIFSDLGIEGIYGTDSRSVEALKLWDTTQYGILILLNKAIHDFCEKNNLDFDFVYAKGNQTYNEGYLKLGRPEVARPYLKHMAGKIGGHCVIPNAHLLDSIVAKILLEYNEEIK